MEDLAAYFVNNTIWRMAEELREFERNEITPVLMRRKSCVNAFFRETNYIDKLLDLYRSNSNYSMIRGIKIDESMNPNPQNRLFDRSFTNILAEYFC